MDRELRTTNARYGFLLFPVSSFPSLWICLPLPAFVLKGWGFSLPWQTTSPKVKNRCTCELGASQHALPRRLRKEVLVAVRDGLQPRHRQRPQKDGWQAQSRHRRRGLYRRKVSWQQMIP